MENLEINQVIRVLFSAIAFIRAMLCSRNRVLLKNFPALNGRVQLVFHMGESW